MVYLSIILMITRSTRKVTSNVTTSAATAEVSR
jgi:hypothetical protein